MSKNYESEMRFTLIEVVVAVAILALGLVTAMGMAANAGNRLNKAMMRWENQHILTQAAEYFLLEGPNSQIPGTIFPYQDYQASCSVEEPENFSEDMETNSGGWRFVKLKITILDISGKEVESIQLEKIFREEDL